MTMPTLACQLLCEGDGDGGFLSKLAEARHLPPFEMNLYSERKGGLEGAIEGFEVFLNREIIKRILIIADNDDDPEGRFKKIQKIVERAKHYPIPKKPLHIRPSENVRVAVIMLPATDEKGNLETLFLKDIAAKRADLLSCARAFAACERNGGQDDWRLGDRDKMLLRSIISVSIKDEPNCSLNHVWTKNGCPIDIQSQEFEFIAKFIGDFFSGPF